MDEVAAVPCPAVRWPAVVAVALVLASCGGGDDPPDPLPRPALVEAADEICRAVEERVDDIDPATAADDLERTKAQLEIERDTLGDLRELRLTDGDQAELDALWDRQEELVDLLDDTILAYEEGRVGDLVTFTNDADRIEPQVDAAFSEYGFEVCGRLPEGSS